MGKNWNRSARAAEGARSQPIDVEDASLEYRDDVSKCTVSLTNTSSQDASDEAIGRSTGNDSTGSSSYCAGGTDTIILKGVLQSAEEEGKGDGRRQEPGEART